METCSIYLYLQYKKLSSVHDVLNLTGSLPVDIHGRFVSNSIVYEAVLDRLNMKL